VLCYGHFDVQPPDPLELWDSAPFEPEIRGERLYGRGVVDDKAQLYMLLAAARELARAGTLPVNVRFACDGEEETGGHSIVEFLEDDQRGANAVVIFDSGMIAEDVPAFNIAMRGIVYFHVELRSGERDLHSGLYGGAALNAAHALIRTLDQLIATDGRLAEPLREGIIPPSAQELEDWKKLPGGAGELAGQGARPSDRDAAEQFYLRTFAEPALDVNGIESGSPHLEKTVLPVHAAANVSVRLAPGQDPDVIATHGGGAARDRLAGRRRDSTRPGRV
jgi:acetylornithine deacetylase/succinyl-diaminopimelate desuccinylase-like protein